MIDIKWKTGENDSTRMQVNEKYGVPFLTFPALSALKTVRHGFSTRLGGVSEGSLSSMNLSYARGDSKEFVDENFKRIAKALDMPFDRIVCSAQTHTTNVRVVSDEDAGVGVTRALPYSDVDGLITNVKNLPLAAFYADCVPLYFIDPVKQAIGLSHSGWRGTKDMMGRATVNAMKKAFDSNPSDIIAAIGPSICQDCYEVSEDVILAFLENFTQKECELIFYKKSNDKYQLNLWEANRLVLLKAGIKEMNIHMPGICTCCNPELLFSHRASKGRRGNLGAFLMLT